jgi:hypothetical protein
MALYSVLWVLMGWDVVAGALQSTGTNGQVQDLRHFHLPPPSPQLLPQVQEKSRLLWDVRCWRIALVNDMKVVKAYMYYAV